MAIGFQIASGLILLASAAPAAVPFIAGFCEPGEPGVVLHADHILRCGTGVSPVRFGRLARTEGHDAGLIKNYTGQGAITPPRVPRAQTTHPASAPASRPAEYEASFRALYRHLGARYPGFKLKGIDWEAVGAELLPQAAKVTNDREFGLLCMQLIARLEDSHAQLLPGSAQLPEPPLPRWSPGLACVMDDRNRPVVYYLEPDGPAARAGVRIGVTVVSVDGKPAAAAIDECGQLMSRYVGYSSERYLSCNAARIFLHRQHRGEAVRIEVEDLAGQTRSFELHATFAPRYVPRQPVPISGIRESADVAFKRMDDNIGYIHIRRIRGGLPKALDRAVSELKDARGLIIDVRGNGGGGFDGLAALRNFNLDDGTEPLRPRYAGPIALLIDGACISAGEGWASWFVAAKRARLFGTATAGASSRKETYTLPNGEYQVRLPVRFYTGFIKRPIERRGLEPDVPVRIRAADLAAGRDTVLETARQYLLATSQPE